MYFVFLSDVYLYEAGYFYAISQRLNFTVNLVQLSEQGKTENSTASILRTMDEIEDLEAEVILLYTNKENIELMLQKVHVTICITFHFFCIVSYVIPFLLCHFNALQNSFQSASNWCLVSSCV